MALVSSQFVKFVMTGGIAALVNIGSRILLSHIFSYEAAIVLAYAFGMTTAFVLAKLIVFAPSNRSAASEAYRFLLVNLVALLQVWLVSIAFDRFIFPWIGFTWHAETIAHTIGVLSPVVASYYGHKFFSFRSGDKQVSASAAHAKRSAGLG